MKTVAIISEYNPFHTGHEYQINKIREEFGTDTRIVAIMSGNYTQRGDIAIADKSLRAKCAVLGGVNLVLELPFPYSSASAEFFAKAGVEIADSIGVVEYLSFGSESGNVDLLYEVARNMLSERYKKYVSELFTSTNTRKLGYPQICDMAYRKLFDSNIEPQFFSPNNILGIEYIKALISKNSKIKPHTIKRFGASYSEKDTGNFEHQSAGAIRELMFKDVRSATEYIPLNLKNAIMSAYQDGQLPCNAERLSAAIISHFRLNLPTATTDIQDAGGGLYNRLKSASLEAENISGLIHLADTKKYTTARIRRVIWYSFLGVTSSEIRELPLYTQALALDSVGKSILKDVKKMSSFPIVTKPSAYDFLSDAARRQKERCDRADSVFQLTKPTHVSGSFALKTSPYIMD